MKHKETMYKDFKKCLKFSILIGAVLIIGSGLVSLAVTQASLIRTLEGIRGTLFVTGSMGLILGAGFMLKRKNQEEEEMEEWKEKFSCFSLRSVLILLSALLIIYGCLIDWLAFSLN